MSRCVQSVRMLYTVYSSLCFFKEHFRLNSSTTSYEMSLDITCMMV